MNIIQHIQTEWTDLADFLDIPNTHVKNMRHLNDKDACRAVFELWLDGEGDEDMPQTWWTIIKVLRKMGHKTLAEQVYNALVD